MLVSFILGLTGFTNLLELSDRFKPFENNLFSPKSIDCQRAVLSREDNKNLDLTIEDFLIVLSPYLLKESSLMCLEWLVYR